MRRRAIAIFATASLALFLLNFAAWARGYWGFVSADWFVRQEDAPEYRDVIRLQAMSDNGGLVLRFSSYRFSPGFETPNQPRWHFIAISRNLLADPLRALVHFNFEVATPDKIWDRAPVNLDAKRSGRFITLEVPHWLPAVLSAIVPALWLRRHLRTRHLRMRQSKGLCPICGYDLRAHSPGQQCPECGTLVAKPEISGAMPTSAE